MRHCDRSAHSGPPTFAHGLLHRKPVPNSDDAAETRFSVKADISSGDHPKSNTMGTFNALLPKGNDFGVLATTGPGPINFIDVHPKVEGAFPHNVTASFDWIVQWRKGLDDGVYAVPGFLIRPADGSRARFVGHRPGAEVRWQVNPHLYFQGDYGIFYAGRLLKETQPGRNLNYLGWLSVLGLLPDVRVTTMTEQHPDQVLPGLLYISTAVTGMIEAVSFLGMGHIFTANMTGNIVFLSFATAGAQSLSVPRSLSALAAFLVGALIGGWIAASIRFQAVGRLAKIAFGIEALLLLSATLASIGIVDASVNSSHVYAVIVLTALAKGVRNAAVRKMALPDLTTTVLTLTVTGLAADSSLAGGSNQR